VVSVVRVSSLQGIYGLHIRVLQSVVEPHEPQRFALAAQKPDLDTDLTENGIQKVKKVKFKFDIFIFVFHFSSTIKFYSFIYYKIYVWHSGGRYFFFQRIQTSSARSFVDSSVLCPNAHVAGSVSRLQSSGLNTRLTFSSATRIPTTGVVPEFHCRCRLLLFSLPGQQPWR
jgi:hypothetical protein